MRFILLAATAALSSTLTAQGTVTDGTVRFQFTNIPTSTTSNSGLSNFTANGTDSTFQHWWYYCVAGDPGGSAFNNSGGQLSQSYTGNTARLSWANVDGRGIRADWLLVVHQDGPNRGRANSHMTLENTTNAPITVSLFCYTDIDLGGSAGGDTARGSVQGMSDFVHSITDANTTDTLQIYARTPDTDEVNTFALVRNKLLSRSGTCPTLGPPFARASGTFGPADYTGAFGWERRTLQPGQILSTWVVLAHNSTTGRSRNATTANACPSTPGTRGPSALVTTIMPFICTGGEIEIRNGLPGAVAVFAANFGPPVCRNILGVSVAPQFPYLFTIPTVLDAQGRASLFAPLQCLGSLTGFQVTWQGQFLDGGSPAQVPVATTNGVLWTLGG